MGYFPFFMDLAGKEGLIVGGGAVAARKIRSLLPYGARLTVAAPELLPEIAENDALTVLRRPFTPELLDGKFFCIAATNDRAENAEIAVLCRRNGILVNVADSRAECTFLCPALVRRGDLTIGISTGGASPSAAAALRRQIDELLPAQLEAILAWLDDARDAAKKAIPDGASRAAFAAALFSACMERSEPLSDEEFSAMLRKFTENHEEEPL
jgi:siroheme synthase-like protein